MKDLIHIKNTFYKTDKYTAGVASLLSVLNYFNKVIEPGLLSKWTETKRGVTNLLGILKAAKICGFLTSARKINLEQLRRINSPVILFVNRITDEKDFLVCYGYENNQFLIGDPKDKLIYYSPEELMNIWVDGITLILELNTAIPSNINYLNENDLYKSGNNLIFLLRNGFIEANEDEVCTHIDWRLYEHLMYKVDDVELNWAEAMRYLRLRLACGDKKSITRLVNKHYLIYLLDCLDRKAVTHKNIIDEYVACQIKEVADLKICPYLTNKLLNYNENKPVEHEPLNNASITFVIPLRIDSEERRRNLDVLLSYLTQFQYASIIILEADKIPKYQIRNNYTNVEYIFIDDSDPVFHRTKYLNILLKRAKTKIVGIWDTDIIVPEKQILAAANEIKEGKAVMSFPYNGRFIMLNEPQTELFLQKESFVDFEIDENWLPMDLHSVGGAFLVNKSVYTQFGGENEFFYGWGPEDAERVKRMEILNFRVYKASGPLIHLYHPRKENSFFASNELQIQNRKEYLKVCSKTKSELKTYINEWKWIQSNAEIECSI